MIYLDFAASTPVLPEVFDEMQPWFTHFYANPSSSHLMGRQAAEAIEQSRAIIADEIGAYPSEIIFTSGATESNNLAIKGIAWANKERGRHIITSSIEHKCILTICAYLEKEGYDITYIAPDCEGVIHPEAVEEALRPDTILVSIHHVNNELGTIQPIEKIGALCLDRGIPFHTDAAQSFGKLDIDVDDLNIDLISISAHKIHGPKGIGALYIRNIRETKLTPVIHGAGQELGLRGGTMATPLIVGFGRATQLSRKNYSLLEERKPQEILLASLSTGNIKTNSKDRNIPSLVSLTIKGLDSNYLFNEFKNNISISNTSACSSLSIEPSHVLKAIGIDRIKSDETLRISFSHLITDDDITGVASIISSSIRSS